jgi:hypothetical protein
VIDTISFNVLNPLCHDFSQFFGTKYIKLMMCSGVPLKFFQFRILSCYSNGQVFKWQARIIIQPDATSGAVANQILHQAASSNGNVTACFNWPSHSKTTRLRKSFNIKVCCASARPSSHGIPVCCKKLAVLHLFLHQTLILKSHPLLLLRPSSDRSYTNFRN